MHSFLRAIGFSDLHGRSDLDRLLGLVMAAPTSKRVIPGAAKGHFLTEISRDFSERAGVTIRGEYDEKGFFHLEHYFPYLRNERSGDYEDVVVNKRMDTDAYTGMCDDFRVGISLIFYLQNSLDYLEVKEDYEAYPDVSPVSLAALSTRGKILLPIAKDEEQERIVAERDKRHDELMRGAADGNEDAMNSLTLEDIDAYAMVSRRIRHETIYSIVESTFIPYGSESDNYTILGEIKDVEKHTNAATGETCTELALLVNDLALSVLINDKDLYGEPAIGRRFKGNVWLQGKVEF